MTTTYYHFWTWTGPTTVTDVGTRLAAACLTGTAVTVIGTERIHFRIAAPSRDAAEATALLWWKTKGLACYARNANDLRFVRADAVWAAHLAELPEPTS